MPADLAPVARRALARALFVALSCAREAGRGEYSRSLQRLADALAQFEQRVTLSVHGRSVCVDGVRVGLDSSSFVAAESLRALFEDHGIAGLTMSRRATIEELDALVGVIGAPTLGDREAELVRRGVRTLRILSSKSGVMASLGAMPGGRGGFASDLRSVYVVKLLLDQVGDSRLDNPRLAKSILRCVADAVLDARELIALLAELQKSELGLVRHGSMVAVYSILIGRRIGLPTAALVELGVAALFHDLGRSAGGDDEHAHVGFEALARLAPSRLTLRAMLVALNHHDRVDDRTLLEAGSGADLLAAIVQTADVYEGGLSSGGTEDGSEALRAAVADGRVPALLATALEQALAAARRPVPSNA